MTVQPAQRQGSASIVSYRFGGRNYPLRTVAQCHTCQSPHRFRIEEEIANGRTYRMILKGLEPLDPEHGLSVESLRNHYDNGHMPTDVEASRRILERRARERGKNVETGVESLVDGMGLAEIVVQKTAEALARGEIQVDLKDGLAAARLLETFAPVEDAADSNAYAEAFMVYHDTLQGMLPPDQFEEFGRRLSANPILRSLVARHRGESEVVEEEAEPTTPQVITLEELEAMAPEEAAALREVDNDAPDD